MARPPLPLGSWGRIKRTELGPGNWVAKARVRDLDGVTRLVERAGKTGAAAERSLISTLTERTAPTSDELTAESRLSLLWETHLARLKSEGRAARTFERYEYAATFITKGLGSVRIREATTQRLDAFLKAVSAKHGASVAKSCRVVLSGMFGLAVRFGATDRNPVRDVSTIRIKSKAARALTVDELRGILDAVRNSPVILNPGNKITPDQTIGEYCTTSDLSDVIVMFAATGCRIGEVLGIRWSDIDLGAKTVSINGKVDRVKGQGMLRDDYLKSEAGERVLPLPDFAVAMLLARQVSAPSNVRNAVFPALSGNWRDPSALSKQWRRVRDKLKFDWVTSHTFRKTLATLLDSEGLSARIGADQLGHAQISMTQDFYMGRKVVHTEVADTLNGLIK
jgi:integrase